jgi:hypothetical protein
MIMQPQKMATGKKADRQGGKGKRDSNSYNALLVVFLFSVLVMIFSMLTLPSDDLDVSANMKKLYIESRSFIRKKKEKKFKSKENLPNSEDDEYHIVFSTACSPFQNWQAYVFFYFAWKVKQPGSITQIVSGCPEEKQEAMRTFHKEKIAPFSDRFHLHFTPDYSKIAGQEFKYFNKPFGVRHWMENAMGYPKNRNADDAIFMILDPDMYFFKPIRNNFTGIEMWKGLDVRLPGPGPRRFEGPTRVEHGRPFAQKYGFDDQWARFNISYVAGADSPALAVEGTKAATDNYAIGPPYMATGKDMYNLVVKWTEFVPRLHEVNPTFLGEMFAFCQAAAHLRLPHTMATGFMISDEVSPEQEGWGFIDTLGRDEVCRPVDVEKLPFVFHYCQRYALGRWFIGKYKLPEQFFFNCSAPLLRVPPEDIAVQYSGYLFPNLQERMNYTNDRPIKQHGFMTCTLIDAFNEVADYYKRSHCEDPNLNKTYIFHTSIEEPW